MIQLPLQRWVAVLWLSEYALNKKKLFLIHLVVKSNVLIYKSN